MKIKPRIKINTNPSRITKIGEYVYHNGNLLLACDCDVIVKENQDINICDLCYFNNKEDCDSDKPIYDCFGIYFSLVKEK